MSASAVKFGQLYASSVQAADWVWAATTILSAAGGGSDGSEPVAVVVEPSNLLLGSCWRIPTTRAGAGSRWALRAHT